VSTVQIVAVFEIFATSYSPSKLINEFLSNTATLFIPNFTTRQKAKQKQTESEVEIKPVFSCVSDLEIYIRLVKAMEFNVCRRLIKLRQKEKPLRPSPNSIYIVTDVGIKVVKVTETKITNWLHFNFRTLFKNLYLC
jgi:hypothetical protein